MAKEFNERIDALGGLRIPASAGSGKIAVGDASGNVSWVSALTPSQLPSSVVSGVSGIGIGLLDAFGHSMAVNGGAAAYAYPTRVALALRARRRNNRAWGGSISCWPQGGVSGDGGYAWVLQEVMRPGSPANGIKPAHPESAAAPYSPRSQVAIHHQTLNDLGELGSLTPRPMLEAHRTIWSRICSAALWESTDAAWTLTGTWSNQASTTRNSGPGYHKTTTLNDTASINVPADYPGGLVFSIILLVDATEDATIGVTVGGVAQPDARLQGSVLCDQNAAAKHNAVVLRFGRASSGAQLSPFDYPVALAAGTTIQLTLKTQTVAGSALNVDCAQIEADPAHGPLLVIPRPNRPYDYSLWASFPHGPSAGTDPMNDAAVATCDTQLQTLGPEFPGRVLFVDIDTSLAKNLLNFQSDHAHPNNQGLGLEAQAICDAITSSGMLTSQLLASAIPDEAAFFEPVGTAGRTPFFSTWTNFGAGALPFGYHLRLDGVLEFRGAVKGGAAANTAVMTLTQGALPSQDRYMAATGNAAWANAKVAAATGLVSMSTGGSTTFEDFDGVSFSVER